MVYHALVAIFKRRKYVSNAIRENKILAKISEFTVYRIASQETSITKQNLIIGNEIDRIRFT